MGETADPGAVFHVELQVLNKPPTVMVIDRPREVGREGTDLVLEDPAVSRRHVRLVPRAEGLWVEDLGSTHGTYVNGAAIGAPTLIGVGDVVRVGDTDLVVLPPPTGKAAAASSRPVVDELDSLENDAVVLRFRPGTPGERVAKQWAAAARRVRRRLAGFGSESWGVRPNVFLVDPFPDPVNPAVVVADGMIIDEVSSEIWIVVTDEAPPEQPGRALTLLFGAALPAAEMITTLIEGFGLYLADTPDLDANLEGMPLPPFEEAGPELRSAMARSWAQFLVDRDGEETLRGFLGAARPDALDAVAQEHFGANLPALEAEWRTSLLTSGEKASPRAFLRLSIRYLWPYRWKQAEIFLYMLVALSFNLVFPFVTRSLFDTALPSGEFSEVLTLLGLLAGVFAVSLLANLRRAYLSAYLSGAVVRDLRVTMFQRLQRLSSSWYQRHQQGDVLSRLFNDVGQVEGGLSQALRDGIFQALSLVVSAAVMLALDLRLGVVVLITLPIIAVVYRLMGTGAQRRSLTVQQRTSSLLGVAAENYDAQPVVTVFGLQGREEKRFSQSSERLFGSERKLVLFTGLFGLSVNLIVTAMRLFVLGLGSWLILEGEMTVGSLVAFLGIMGEVVNPVTSLTDLAQELQSATGALVRVNEIIDAEPEISDPPDAQPAPRVERSVELEDVSFGYDPHHLVLQSMSAVIPAGSRVAFVGPSGSGKSTILRLLMRIHDPLEGAIHFDGRDARLLEVDSLRSNLGVVFQDSFLFDTTIRENIRLGRPGASDDEVESAARSAEVHSFIDSLPNGYETIVGERGALLSGGQRQRVAIARALIRDPSVLLLDEATSALDSRTERQIMSTLNEVGAGRTTVSITHRLTSIADYDQIFVIVDGQLAESGTHERLLEAGRVYSELWAEQTGDHSFMTRPFDPVPALARVPLFRDLDEEVIVDLASRLQPLRLNRGDVVEEGGGQLFIIAQGRAQVVAPGQGGDVTIAELGPGETFGLRALMGNEAGCQLRATSSTTLDVLQPEFIAAAAAQHESVAAALGGDQGTRPSGGRRVRSATKITRPVSASDVGPEQEALRMSRRMQSFRP